MATNQSDNYMRTYKVVEVEYEPHYALFGLIRWDTIVSKTTIGSHICAVLSPDSPIEHITIYKGDKEYITKFK